MKKVYTYEVKRKIQWPKSRCPKCGNGWIEEWHQVDPDAYEANEEWPLYHAAWFIQCPRCEYRTYAFHKRKSAWKAWKDQCKSKDTGIDWQTFFEEEE